MLAALPKASGASVAAPGLSRSLMAVMSVAQTKAKEVGDDYVSTEHLLVGLADSGGDVAELLKQQQAIPKALVDAFGWRAALLVLAALLAACAVPQAVLLRRAPADLGLRYRGVAPTGPLPASIDFGLTPSPEADAFDARVQRIYGGTNEIMKVLIARSL